MGVSSSKHNAPSSSSSNRAVVRRCGSSRSSNSNVAGFRSQQCSSNDDAQVSDCSIDDGRIVSRTSENKSGSCRGSSKCYRTDKGEQSDGVSCIASDNELDGWDESGFTATVPRESNNSLRASSSRSLTSHSRFISRFSFYPGTSSFRLTKANSLDSARAHQASPSCTISNDEEAPSIPSATSVHKNKKPQGCDFFPACFANRSLRTRSKNGARNLQSGHSSLDFSDSFPDVGQLNSGHDVVSSRNDTRSDCSPDLFSAINHTDNDGSRIRHANRRRAAQEPVERNIRFSRTLSVGRLRDRVLRRTPGPDLDLCHLEQDWEVRHASHGTGRWGSRNATAEPRSENNNVSQQGYSNDDPSVSSVPFYGSPDHVHETSRARETRYRDLLEHRSNFLERRRRIRSQVRALQRLGSRFENLPGHERSCVLSGQHRTGHCTCRAAARGVNSSDNGTTSASISRIVMLAEALFEVLDEINQQSVVFPSRPSVSSIGSIPAPTEVVNSLPVNIYSKLKKKPSEEAAVCYICLVEYEEGDSMRILPCRHEFHRACVDKWLKEIHRVCPLCRGDICRPESFN